jgi:octaprenyl-diphosphate synthase
VKKSGGIEYAKKAMDRYYQDALTLLSEFPESTYKSSLRELVQFTIERRN